jgi:hypothetical protein
MITCLLVLNTILTNPELRWYSEQLLWIIVIIVVIIVIVAILKFLFQLFFVMPVGMDYSSDLLNAKEILVSLKY